MRRGGGTDTDPKILTIKHSNIPTGSYNLTVNFTGSGGELLFRIDQVVNVYGGLTTNKFIGNAGTPYTIDGNGKITITEDNIKAFALSTIYVGGTGIGGKAASDSNGGSQFDPVVTLARAVALVNSFPLATPVDGFKIFVQGNINTNGDITLNSGKTLVIKSAIAGTKYTITGVQNTFTAQADLTTTDLIFDKMRFSVSANLTMTNCTVKGNNNTSGNGGGVYVNSGIFTMSGGEISGNTAKNGGGVYVDSSGIFTMSGGKISSNTADNHGGGVYVGGDSITANASFTMSGGTISGNTAAKNGGGIYALGKSSLLRAKVEISSNAEISGNTSTSGNGGGIMLASFADLTMSGGTVSGNKAIGADGKGNGIYIPQNNTFSISGSAKIAENNDVYLGDSVVTVADALTGTTPVATITPASYTIGISILTDSSSGTLVAANYTKFAVTDQVSGGSTIEWTVDNEGKLNRKFATVYLKGTDGNDSNSGEDAANAVASLAKALGRLDLNAATPTIIIVNEYKLKTTDSLDFSNTTTYPKAITIMRYTGCTSNLITVAGCSATIKRVTINGNKSNVTAQYPLISVESTGTVTIGDGAEIKNNKNTSSNYGSAIYSEGNVTITGTAVIKDNEVSNGGVICNKEGTLTMSGGTVSGNTATYGGGVYVYGGTFTMSGGTISGNSGGGVCVNDGMFNMSGAAYIPAGGGSNDVYLALGKYITIIGALTGTTPVATITPDSYVENRQVLAAGGSVTALTQAICDQFALSDATLGFVIQPGTNTAQGLLIKPVVSGGIIIDIPGSGTYVFNPTYGGTTVNAGDTLTYNSASSFAVTVTKADGSAIAETPTIKLRDTGGNTLSIVPPLLGTHSYQLYMKVVFTSGVVLDKTIDISIANP